MIVASFLGGSLADTRGWTLSHYLPIFESYPYLLPMLLASFFPLISGLTAFFFLEETLPPTPKTTSTTPAPSYRDLITRHIGLVIVTFAVQSLTGLAIRALLPLFCFTPVSSGGLGFNAQQIGLVISQRSFLILLLQVFGFPSLQRHIGTVRLHRWTMMLWIPTFAILPFLNVAARGHQTVLQWAGLLRVYAHRRTRGHLGRWVWCLRAGLTPVCNLMMTNNAAPSPQLLGALNGFSQMTSSLVGVVGPSGASSLFAVSVQQHLLGGYLVWVVIGAIAAVGAVAGWMIRDEDDQKNTRSIRSGCAVAW